MTALLTLTDEERRLVEPLPDLVTLTDDDLRVMIRELEKEEDEISFRRRVPTDASTSSAPSSSRGCASR